MTLYLYPFVVALVIAFAITPVMKAIAFRIGALKQPNARSVHTAPVAQLGGVAIYIAFAISSLIFARSQEVDLQAILIGSGLMMALGVWDDLKPLSARAKLLGQIAVAVVLVLMGVRIDFITNPAGGLLLMGRLAGPVTVIWIVALANVVNLIDGIDGLAAGVSSIAALSLLFVALRQGQASVAVLTAALAGSALGFLRYNFNPAKIFMGDAGALFLGCALAAISIEGTLKSAAAVAVAVPVLALGLPIFDTFFAIVRRIGNGQPIAQADRGHLHHRLLDRGLTQRQACFVMYGISALLGLVAVALTIVRAKEAILILGFVGTGIFVAARRTGVLEIRETKVSAKR